MRQTMFAAVAVACLALPASAETVIHSERYGGWTHHAILDRGQLRCDLVTRSRNNRALLAFFGIAGAPGQIALVFGHESWGSLDGHEFDVTIETATTIWTAVGIGLDNGGIMVADLTAEFVVDMARKREARLVVPELRYRAPIDLTGTMRGITAMLGCLNSEAY